MKAAKHILPILCLFMIVSAREKFKDDEPATYRSKNMAPGQLAIEPTHYLYVPSSAVLDQKEFILSFHEMSIGMDKNLQLFLSPFYSISGIFLGVKYAKTSAWAFGAGLAGGDYWRYQYWQDRWGRVYLHTGRSDYGIGAYLTKSMSGTKNFAAALRIWSNLINMEGGLGGKSQIAPLTQILYEGGFGIGLWSGGFTSVYLEGALGVRYTLPSYAPVKITAGLGINKQLHYQWDLGVWPYLDVSWGTNF